MGAEKSLERRGGGKGEKNEIFDVKRKMKKG